MGARKFPLLFAVLCYAAIFTNGYPQGSSTISRGGGYAEKPATNANGYDVVSPATGSYRYNERLSAIDDVGYIRQLPAINAFGNFNKIPANNTYKSNEKLLSVYPVGYKELPPIGVYRYDRQPPINNEGYNKFPAISNIGYNNPNQLPAVGAYGYDVLPAKDAYGYVNEKPVPRPLYTTTQRPDFSNEPATTLPPLTPRQQIYVTLMNAVMGNISPDQNVMQAAALG